MVVIRVHPSPVRPHHLKRLGPDQGVFVRVGSTNRRADGTLIEALVGWGLVVELGTGPHDPKRKYFPARRAGTGEDGP